MEPVEDGVARWQRQVLVVIPSIQGGTLLARMLPTLRHDPANVVVLDQGSTDETGEVCAAAGVELVQLGRAHTYTEACNIGARLATERGFPYLCVANNDITFRSDVLGALHAAMEADPALGIVAPSQLIRDAVQNREFLSVRVYWDLGRVDFQHDLAAVPPGTERLEADFCELTCPLIRMAAIRQIGFLDDEYGFYHEDADFGFRLRRAGWSCAYLPEAQIVHYTSSTFSASMSERKREYIARNRRRFIAKHLGFGLRLPSSCPALGDDGPAMLTAFGRYGLADPDAAALSFGPPGADDEGYLFVTEDQVPVPQRWARHAARYRGVFAPSAEVQAALLALGFQNVHPVTPGIDPDVFHPWGARMRPGADRVFLALCDGWRPDRVRAVLAAWARVPAGQLVMLGRGLHQAPGRAPDEAFAAFHMVTERYAAERITVHDLTAPLTGSEAAALFRGADFAIPQDDGRQLDRLKLAACGVPTVAEGAPGPNTLHDALAACLRLDENARRRLGRTAAYRARATGTVRNTALGLHQALSHLQIREPAAVLARLDRDEASAEAAEAASYGVEPLPPPPRAGLGAAMGRRVETLGRLTSRFGAAWSEEGLGAARRAVGAELKYFVASRTGATEDVPPPPRREVDTTLDPAVLLVGYVDAQLGLGQSSRGLARAMAAAGIDFRTSPIATGVEGRRTVPFMPERVDTDGVHAVNVIETTVDELASVLKETGERRAARSYNILRTYWELSRAPDSWRDKLRAVQEVWAPNEFVAAAFRQIFDGPVMVVPPCLDVPQPEPGGHALFGLDPARCWFLFSFDWYSFPQRKNPLAVVRSFRRAFPDPSTPAGLIVKAAGAAGHHPSVRAELSRAAFLDPRIVVLDEQLTRTEMLALMTACSCYVSLHRAEGFGLGMAEAMALGKPVIATDYSGSTDFLSAETGYPVPASLCRVGADEYVHPAGQVWAEPDEAAAAAAMAEVVADPRGALVRGEAGQAFVRYRYGSEHVGALVAARLAQLPVRPGRAMI